jgi:hypothetical protein
MGYINRLLRTGQSFNELVDASNYDKIIKTRNILKCSKYYLISKGHSMMSMNIGLDNYTILPPFMPIFRNEEGVFNSIIKNCFNNLYNGYVPFMIYHEGSLNKFERIKYPRYFLNDFLIDIIHKHLCLNSLDPVESLESLGKHLIHVSKLSTEDFKRFIRNLRLEMVENYILFAERRLEVEGNAPVRWANDVNTFISGLLDNATKEYFMIPHEVHGKNFNEKLISFKNILFKFGSVLIYWNKIREASKELISNNISMITAQ